jgi:phage protein D
MPASTSDTLFGYLFLAVDGRSAPDDLTHALLEITVESNLHLPDVATLVLYDPDLRWIDDPSLAPGKALGVSGEAGGQPPFLFDGEIVEIEPRFDLHIQHLLIRAFDRRHRLARGRHVRSFQNVSDADLVQQLAQEVQLEAQVSAASQVHPYVLQNNQTNFEFLRARAAALGNVFFVRGKTLHCEPLRASGQPVTLERGTSLHEFRPRLTTLEQVDEVTVRGWDPDAKRDIVGEAQQGGVSPHVGESRSGGDLAHGAFSVSAKRLVTDRAIRTQTEADRLAQAELDRVSGRFIEAEGRCAGNPAIVAGSSIKVEQVGQRFGGTYFVTRALHVYRASEQYTTYFSVSAHHQSELLALLNPEPQRALISGLVVGVVTDNQDPNGDGRVKVRFPSLSKTETSDWARVVAVGGGAQRGIEFLPEVDDEVLVGFELGDVHFPYVLGGLWNGHDAPPTRSNQLISGGKVQKRIIRSRTGHTITLDDSEGGSVSIVDKNGNKVVLDSQANTLTIEVKGDATLKAQGNMTLQAQGSMTLQAQGHVDVKGMGVKVDGQAGTVDVSGTTVNLN